MNLKLARIKNNYTIVELAKILHVGPQKIIKWERGEEIDNIRFGKMKEIAKLFNTTVQELFF